MRSSVDINIPLAQSIRAPLRFRKLISPLRNLRNLQLLDTLRSARGLLCQSRMGTCSFKTT